MPPHLRTILLFAFALRSLIFGVAYFSQHNLQVFYAKDTWSYLQPAMEWWTVGSFTTDGEPEIFRTPGYPVLLGVGIKLGQIEVATIAVQILLSCITTLLVFRIAKELFENERTATWSALLYSVEPLSLIACSWLLSETLFAALLAAALYLLLVFARHRKTSPLIIAAVFFVAATYVRPIGYFLPLVLTVVMLLCAAMQREWSIIKPALLFCLLSFALLSLWQVRNYRQAGYAGFSVALPYNLYFHSAAALRANQEQRPFYEVLDELGFYDREKYLQAHPEQHNWSLAQRYEFMQREGFRAIWQAPMTAGKIYLRGLAIAVFDPGATEYLRLFQAYPRSGRLMNTMVNDGVISLAKTLITQQPLLFGLSALFGLWLLFNYALAWFGQKGQPLSLPLVLLLMTGLYQLALAGGTLASGRFRTPVMIVVCAVAGQGFSRLKRRKG